MATGSTMPTPTSRLTDSVSTATPRILIADDQPDVLEALRLLLKGEDFQVETASSPRGVIAALETS